MKSLGLAIALMVLIVILPPDPTKAADCQFVLGFQIIHDQIPDIVGECVVDQHYNPDNGDALQETTGGMLVWRKADNFTAFTDGFRSWVNGPLGLLERLNTERFDWEASAPQAGPAPTPDSAPPAVLPPANQAPSGFDPSRYISRGDNYNCDDFRSQADAQAVLRADPGDPNRLDNDRDGIACQSNPGPFDLLRVPR